MAARHGDTIGAFKVTNFSGIFSGIIGEVAYLGDFAEIYTM